jgi:hypothetical protein
MEEESLEKDIYDLISSVDSEFTLDPLESIVCSETPSSENAEQGNVQFTKAPRTKLQKARKEGNHAASKTKTSFKKSVANLMVSALL